MSQFTKLQNVAINKANKMLKKEPWYRGVCVNKVPSDAQIKKYGVHRAAQKIWDETYYYDGLYYAG